VAQALLVDGFQPAGARDGGAPRSPARSPDRSMVPPEA
jgi:hypothetical protein